MATVVSAIWGHVSQELSISLTAPWEEGGKTKYAGQAAFIVGGSSSVGQYGVYYCLTHSSRGLTSPEISQPFKWRASMVSLQ